MMNYVVTILIAICLAQICQCSENKAASARNISPFSIIRFQNGPCVATGNKNGTCYTADECKTKGGVNNGACASSYGVCCTFSGGCGAAFSENCTYFESLAAAAIVPGSCTFKVCKMNSDICQFRLDFNSFVISGPSSDTTDAGLKTLNGQLLPGAANAKKVNLLGSCSQDSFQVTSPGFRAPTVICGTNTNEHMYVDASDQCNNLIFQIGQAAATTRQWSIKITQYNCEYDNLAPTGCTQYFFGPASQVARSYNFAGGQHLANQNQNVCVRRERGNCRICWTTVAATDFDISGLNPAAGPRVGFNNAATGCCGFGTMGTKTNGFDCVVIPGAQNKATMAPAMVPSQLCGRALITPAAATPATVCSETLPFNLRFLSDQYEFIQDPVNGEGVTGTKGFQLMYTMDAKC